MPSFLAPLFLIGTLTAAIPLLLHLLKRQPEVRIRFAAVRFLQQGPVEHSRQRRLRDLLLLLARVAALVLLAAAFARPFFAAAESAPGSVTIVALDTSLSLSAAGQFDRARSLARDAVRRAAPADAVAVVTFADEARVASGLSSDRALAIAAIDAASTDAGSTRYRAALHASVEAMAGRSGTIVVVTDLQASGWDTGDRVALPEGANVDLLDVGPPPSNLAVTAVRVSGDRLIATVRNSGPDAREARVSVAPAGPDGSAARPVSAGTPAAIVTIAANQVAEAVLPRPSALTAAVTVADPGGIAADNVRYLALDHSGQSSVLVVSTTGDLAREAFYLRQALTVGGADGRAHRVDGGGAAALSTWDPSRVASYDAVFLVSTAGMERRGRELISSYVRGGGGVFVAAGQAIDGEVVADAVGQVGKVTIGSRDEGAEPGVRGLVPLDTRHPLFARFATEGASLSLAHFRRIAAIRGADCQLLARFTTSEPAVIDCPSGAGHTVILASDVDNRWNDFPLRAMFVPFVHEAIAYLSSSQSHQSEYIVGEQPPGIGREPGISSRLSSGDTAKWVVVNVDPKEADLTRMSTDVFQSALARVKNEGGHNVEGGVDTVRRQREDQQHMWQYLMAFALIVLVGESLLAARTA